MKKIFLFLILLPFLKTNSQNMKSDTIKLSSTLDLHQKITSEKEKTTWQLFLDKKGEKTLELENIIIGNFSKDISPDLIPSLSKDLYLYIPSLIDAFKEDNCLYVFIYKDRRLMFYEFEFTNNKKFNKKSQKVTEVLIGSIDNFGGYNFDIQKYNISNKYYFYLNYGRDVGGKNNVLLSFNKMKIKKLFFSEQKVKIKDENELFKTLDLEQNKEKVSEEIKKVLIENNLLKKEDKFNYLGNIDLTSFKKYQSRFIGGMIYFFYQQDFSTKIIRYDNDDNEWLLGDYKEEEIKEE
jgi:hypothetical protein